MERKIEDLLRSLTLTEKVALLSGQDQKRTTPVPRVGIPELVMYDGPHGVRADGPTTGFPTGVAMGATWNSELIGRVGAALGDEARASGYDVLLGPCVNMVRHPLGGRNFETYTEDPHLAGELGVAYVQGLQGRGVGASVKHYACNNQEIRRDRCSSEVDERTLREIYLPHFEAIVKRARPWTIMSSYNRINGVYASEHRHLLREILKEEWGFDGVVVSDWGGNHTTVESVRGGLDLEMPGPAKYYGGLLVEAVNNWQLDAAAVDEAARRMLRLLARAGKLGGVRRRPAGAVNTPAHQALARRVAEEALVLLKNDGSLLPFDGKAIRSLAVVGPTAGRVPIGGGSSKNSTPHRVSPLDALRTLLGRRVEVRHEPGVENHYDVPLTDTGWLHPATGEGKGWSAEYYDNLDLAGAPVCERVEGKLHFWRFGNAPAEGMAWDRYSCRWTGLLTVPHAGRYRLEVACTPNSVVRVLQDGRRVGAFVPEAGSAALPMAVAELDLEAGRTCRISVEYVKLPSQEAAYAQLRFIPLQQAGFEDGVQRAATLAARSDAAVVCVGFPEDFEGEGQDRPDLALPGAQAELIRAVVRANPRTVVVLHCGSPVAMPWLADIPALLLAWYPGQEGGHAIARVLFGAVNPSGRLPVTFPKRLEDTPAFGQYPGERQVFYGEGVFVGYRHYDQRAIEPLFPFGFGLSYHAPFRYGGLRIPRTPKPGETLRVALTVRNPGVRAGAEVVQVYVADPQSSLPRPPRELKAFRKVFLEPGETRRIEFQLNARDFSFYDPARQGWVLEPGTFEVQIGRSSRDICLRKSFELA